MNYYSPTNPEEESGGHCYHCGNIIEDPDRFQEDFCSRNCEFLNACL